MIEILLIIIIILLAPWLLDIIVGLGMISVGIIFIILTILGLIMLYGHYPELIGRIIGIIFILYMSKYILYDSLIKHIIDGYNSKD